MSTEQQRRAIEDSAAMDSWMADVRKWVSEVGQNADAKRPAVDRSSVTPPRGRSEKSGASLPIWDYGSWDSTTPEKVVPRAEEKPSCAQTSGDPSVVEREKEAGNSLFRQGKFFQASQSYSRALEACGEETSCGVASVVLANRSICWLKLEKPNEAERDASEAVRRDPRYAKAYFRRAAARRALGRFQEALDDLNKVLELEPDSKQAADEKLAVSKEIAAHFHIEETKQEQEEPSAPAPSPPPAQASPTPEPQPRKVEVVPSAVVVKPVLPQEPPKSFYQFQVHWSSMVGEPEMRAKLLQMIPRQSFASVFGDSLSPAMLGEIVRLVQSHIVKESPETASSILLSLGNVGRFGMLSMCLGSADKQIVRDLAASLKSSSSDILAAWRLK